MIRYELGNILFQILLCLETHVAQSHVTQPVVPFQYLIRILNLGITRDPRREFFIGRSSRHHVLKLLRDNAGEGKPLACQRTGPVIVLTVPVQKKCPALVDATSRNYIAAKFFSGGLQGNVFRRSLASFLTFSRSVLIRLPPCRCWSWTKQQFHLGVYQAHFGHSLQRVVVVSAKSFTLFRRPQQSAY